MTKKHFIAIAKQLANVPDNNTKQNIIARLCTVFKEDNCNFDSYKFIQACAGNNSVEQ